MFPVAAGKKLETGSGRILKLFFYIMTSHLILPSNS